MCTVQFSPQQRGEKAPRRHGPLHRQKDASAILPPLTLPLHFNPSSSIHSTLHAMHKFLPRGKKRKGRGNRFSSNFTRGEKDPSVHLACSILLRRRKRLAAYIYSLPSSTHQKFYAAPSNDRTAAFLTEKPSLFSNILSERIGLGGSVGGGSGVGVMDRRIILSQTFPVWGNGSRKSFLKWIE